MTIPHCTNWGMVPAKFNYRPISGLARGVFYNHALSNEIGVTSGNLDGPIHRIDFPGKPVYKQIPCKSVP